MARRVIIHIGVHKTGSTLLQENLLSNISHLRDQSVYYAGGERPQVLRRQRRILRHLQNRAAHPDADPEALRALNDRIARRAAAAGARTILMSEENYLGAMVDLQLFWKAPAGRFYPDAGRCLQALTAGIAPEDIRLVLYTRGLEALLRGHYGEGLKSLWVTEDYAAFLDRIDLDSFRFDALVARIEAALPGVEVVVLPFESIRAGAAAFVARFFEVCGIDPAPLKIRAHVINEGLDARQAEALRRLAVAGAAGEDRAHLKRQATLIKATPARPDDPIRLPGRFRARVEEVARGDLSERLMREQNR